MEFVAGYYGGVEKVIGWLFDGLYMYMIQRSMCWIQRLGLAVVGDGGGAWEREVRFVSHCCSYMRPSTVHVICSYNTEHISTERPKDFNMWIAKIACR